jgi:glycosyltransferase involved in cell wall biosynthesis
LLVVGGGPSGSDRRLWQAARAAGLAEAVSVLGLVPFASLPAVLRCADVAIYPIADTLINRAKAPVKLLELLALGLPTVAERVGETSAYLDDGAAGQLTPSGDDERLAAAVASLLHSPDRRADLGAHARSWVWRTYSWATLVARAELAYRQLVGSGPAAASQRGQT